MRRHARSGKVKIAMQQVLHARKNGRFVVLLIDPTNDEIAHEIPLAQMSDGDVFELQVAWEKDDE